MRGCEVVVRCFFFSSRRRHTRLVSDWSSDVCSSDLFGGGIALVRSLRMTFSHVSAFADGCSTSRPASDRPPVFKRSLWQGTQYLLMRSEERRVGKGSRCGWGQDRDRKRKAKRGRRVG